MLNYKNRKNITESIVLSVTSYCLAVWGYKYKWRRTVQKALNHAVRMVLEAGPRSSITDGLKSLKWLNMDNNWRLEQAMSIWRLVENRNSPILWDVIMRANNRVYIVRQDGVRFDWWPKTCHGTNAFMWNAMKLFNELRIPQSSWYNTVMNRKMTKKEIRDEVKLRILDNFPNENMY